MLGNTGAGAFPERRKGLPSRCSPSDQAEGVSGFSYLEAGTVIRKRGVEEAAHDVHDGLRHTPLQKGVCVFPVSGGVTDLERKRSTSPS